jgi:hypothetical protein
LRRDRTSGLAPREVEPDAGLRVGLLREGGRSRPIEAAESRRALDPRGACACPAEDRLRSAGRQHAKRSVAGEPRKRIERETRPRASSQQAGLLEVAVQMDDPPRGASRAVVRNHDAERLAPHRLGELAARGVERLVDGAERTAPKSVRQGIVSRARGVVIAPEMVRDGVALREDHADDVRAPSRVALPERPKRLDREAGLLLDAAWKDLRRALVPACVVRPLGEVGRHPGARTLLDLPVERGIAARLGIASDGDGSVEARHEEPAHPLGRPGRRHAEREHRTPRPRHPRKDRLPGPIGGVHEAEPVGPFDFLREVEKTVLARADTGQERRPRREAHRRERARERARDPVAKPCAEGRQPSGSGELTDHVEARAVEAENEERRPHVTHASRAKQRDSVLPDPASRVPGRRPETGRVARTPLHRRRPGCLPSS